MSTPVRLAAFLVVLVLVGAAGFGVGRLAGPFGPVAEQHGPDHVSTSQEQS